ncbi:MAG TPA: R3H domain-containing nucleic acid-binding protein [Thermoanaerobaculia bacterium]|jgi:spoIIIJ-associated protein|nr:R3H domain-containing nucleic acid-binding protein [Thermoanaerobaculia bacterium]
MSQRFEGRNLEDALQQAAQTFGVERWALTYHVLLEKRGFLGGMKRIVIEADVNTDAAEPQAPAPVVESRPPRTERGPRGGGGGGRGGGGRDRGGRHEGGGGRGRRGGSRRDEGRDFRSGDFETFLGDVPEQGPESDAARTAREWVETCVVLSRLDVIARTEENDTQIQIRLYGSDGARLTDKHGELLDAIQVLANKALVGRKVEKEIELDCEEFKGHREEDLGRRAREVADRVRLGGREELLPAMSPIERRIVHIALRDDADVTTESRGEGFFKRVAIIPRPAEAAPETQPEP